MFSEHIIVDNNSPPGFESDPDDYPKHSISYYDRMRTMNNKGLTIPS